MARQLAAMAIVLVLGEGRSVAGPSNLLVQALKTYEAGDYHQASTLLQRVVDETTVDRKDRQRAEFWLGKTLYHLGFYAASLAFFDRVARAGPAHAYHEATVKWLVSLAGKLPDEAQVIKTLAAYKPDAVLAATSLRRLRDDLAYLLGRRQYQQGAFPEAARLFRQVQPGRRYFQARMMAGMAELRRFQARAAGEAFKDVLRAARRGATVAETRGLDDLARLSLARLFYSTGQYRLAVKHWGKVPARSRYHAEAVREQAWGYYRAGDRKQALKSLHAGQDAETLLLEALIHHEGRESSRSLASLARLETLHGDLPGKLEAVLAKTRDPTDFYDVALRIRRGKATDATSVFLRRTLTGRQLERTMRHVEELDRELKLMNSSPAAWKATAVAGVVLQDLTLQRSLVVNQAGQLARMRIQVAASELTSLLKQARVLRQAASAKSKQGGKRTP